MVILNGKYFSMVVYLEAKKDLPQEQVFDLQFYHYVVGCRMAGAGERITLLLICVG